MALQAKLIANFMKFITALRSGMTRTAKHYWPAGAYLRPMTIPSVCEDFLSKLRKQECSRDSFYTKIHNCIQ